MTATVPAYPADLNQKLTAEELEQARIFLEQTHAAVIGATKGLSEAQWNFKPAPDRWSIAENLDHIVVVIERVLGPIHETLANAPPPPAGVDSQLVDSIVIHQFPTRLSRFPSPDLVQPAGQASPGELLDRVSAGYARLAGRLESEGLRRRAIDSPPLKAVTKGAFSVMDGYQWILAAAAHSERHVKQMLEVMASPAYPA